MRTNIDRFLADQKRYFSGSHDQFLAFGGPWVYFHEQCLLAGAEKFLSLRHIEMLYATLTAWGMHRMGTRIKPKRGLRTGCHFTLPLQLKLRAFSSSKA